MGLKLLLKNIKYLTKNKLHAENDCLLFNMINILSKEYQVFVIPKFSFGETVIFGSLMHEYKNVFKKKIIIFCVGKSNKLIYSLFADVDFVEEISSHEYYKIQRLQTNNQYNNIRIMGNPYRRSDRKIFNMADIIKAELNLPENSKLCNMVIDDNYNNEIEKKFPAIKMADYSKNILIVPEACCLGNDVVPKTFWTHFSKIMTQKGYNIVFNTQLACFKKHNCIFPNIKEILSLSNKFKYIIGVRTGLLDALSNYNKKSNIVVVYPNKTNSCWKKNPDILENLYNCCDIEPSCDFAKDYLATSSIANVFDGNITELIYSKEETLSTIMDLIFQNKDI